MRKPTPKRKDKNTVWISDKADAAIERAKSKTGIPKNRLASDAILIVHGEKP